MPCSIGCIDGTQIPAWSPGGCGDELYRCHKDFLAYTVMAVCNASLVLNVKFSLFKKFYVLTHSSFVMRGFHVDRPRAMICFVKFPGKLKFVK